jgi:bisphosphoglycerate-independent phosphoglycerate mutase (AlkP superfamily)
LDFITKPFDTNNLKQFSKEEMMQYSLEPVVGVLSDVAPTILSILEIEKPPEMVGVNLIETM